MIITNRKEVTDEAEVFEVRAYVAGEGGEAGAVPSVPKRAVE